MVTVTIFDRRSVDADGATSLLYFFLSTIASLSCKTRAYIPVHRREERKGQ
jgi:hypothetical protein